MITTALSAPSGDRAPDTHMAAVHERVGGIAHDDIALILLEHPTPALGSANWHLAAIPISAPP